MEGFAAFGRVTKGMEVVDAINKASVTDEKPEKPVRIKKATVRSCSGLVRKIQIKRHPVFIRHRRWPWAIETSMPFL